MVASLRCALHVAVQQNNELRSRLQKIRSEAEVAIEGPNLTMSLELDLNASARLGHHSLSYSSSCVSQSEFFDAKEYLTDVAVSDSSSDASETEMEGENEAEEEGSVSEASEMGNEASHDPGFRLVIILRRPSNYNVHCQHYRISRSVGQMHHRTPNKVAGPKTQYGRSKFVEFDETKYRQRLVQSLDASRPQRTHR